MQVLATFQKKKKEFIPAPKGEAARSGEAEIVVSEAHQFRLESA